MPVGGEQLSCTLPGFLFSAAVIGLPLDASHEQPTREVIAMPEQGEDGDSGLAVRLADPMPATGCLIIGFRDRVSTGWLSTRYRRSQRWLRGPCCSSCGDREPDPRSSYGADEPVTAVCGADPRQAGTALVHPHPSAGGDRCGQQATTPLWKAMLAWP